MNIDEELEKLIQNLGDNFNILSYIAKNNDDFVPGESTVLYSGPFWGHEEIIAAIKTLLMGKWISSGQDVKKFEDKFAKKINEKYGLMVNSGSSANLLMIASLKHFYRWENGSEVIVSPTAFPTTISVLPQNNLVPVFVDINLIDLNIDLNLIEEKITNKTVAIFLSPILANPPDMDRILKICQDHNLKLILDGCDSLGSTWNGNFLNEYACATSDSLYSAHHISCGEGGMITSNIEEIIKYARSLSYWSRDCFCQGSENTLPNGMCKTRFSPWLKDYGYEDPIDHKYFFTGELGYNLKPLDLQGSIGLVQLEKLDTIIELRRKHYKIISEYFKKYVNNIYIPNELPQAKTSWFGIPIICDTKEQKQKLVMFLEKNRIQTRNLFSGNILQHPGYKHLGDYREYKNANEVLRRVLFVGCSPHYGEKILTYIEDILKKYEN
jgi:CDP-6-deoxy-D-xylo-4-hexulose-3-dehydrase